MSKCIKCGSKDAYNYTINNGMCDPCIEGMIENIQDDNVAKEGRIKELEGLLAKQELVSEFYLDGIDKSQAEIATLEAELEKCQWVDINERLPEEGQNILIFGHERNHGVPFSAIWDWKSKNAFNTHWKPITIPQTKEQSND